MLREMSYALFREFGRVVFRALFRGAFRGCVSGGVSWDVLWLCLLRSFVGLFPVTLRGLCGGRRRLCQAVLPHCRTAKAPRYKQT